MRSLALLPLLAALGACAALPEGTAPDPRQGEVPIATETAAWEGRLIVDNGTTGIWTVKAFPFFDQYACPEVIGLDDRGRCLVCVSYSGKWTPNPVIEDGKWLGGLAHGDVDPRLEGAELYTGGQKGNLYQVVPYRNGALDYRRIAYLPGREIHTILGGELDPSHDGPELLVFTRPGGLYRVTPTGPHGTFETTLVAELPGRVRDALVIAGEEGPDGPPIATVTRAGSLQLLRMTADGPHWETVYEDPMGMGRIVQGRGCLYSCHDDGRILRHSIGNDGTWAVETIFLGPQGPRGIAAGRFHADPNVESVAVFGYSGKVQLLTRIAGRWVGETIFVDRDRGHWLTTAELDGRNGTDEILTSGYGGRIVMLTRPPGYGRSELTNR